MWLDSQLHDLLRLPKKSVGGNNSWIGGLEIIIFHP